MDTLILPCPTCKFLFLNYFNPLFSFIPCICYYRIQYVRHLHEKVSKIDERTAPKKEHEAEAEAHAAAAAAMGGSMMGFGETLMLTNGGYDQGYGQPQYGGGYPPQQGYGGQMPANNYGGPAGYY